MILSGILHSSLGGFTVIRGVAPLGELARCSRFDPAYQRNLIDTHKAEIERFLADRQYLFFPEVILSASLRFDFNAYKGKQAVAPVNDVLQGTGFKSNVDGLSIKVVAGKLPKGMETVGASSAPQIAYLDVPEAQLDAAEGLRLFRIDGNHRLSAAKDLKPGEATYALPTPFCIVLHDDPQQAQRFEKVVFHNINAKQIPLTSEENLRLILQDGTGSLFTDADLLDKPSFGPAYYLARKLLPELDTRFLGGLAKPFEYRHTLALALTQFLAATHDTLIPTTDAAALDAQVARLREALKAVNSIYEDASGDRLRTSGCHGVLVSFTYFALKNQGKQLQAFARWVFSNRIDRLTPATTTRGIGYHYHLGRTQAVDAASLVEVFESVLSARKREVFVSMEFGTHTDDVYKAIETAIDQVNKKHALQQADLALVPVRIDRENKGHSYTIADEILRIIDGCGLLIADLTQSNKNVYHEVGFLMGLNQGRGDLNDNFILLADSNQVKDTTIGFNLRAWQQIRYKDTLGLTTTLVAALEQHFDLAAS